MIDFTGARAIMIPEGNVIRIMRKLNGLSIWEKPGGSLPIGYTQVDYIESNGTQYIDTNYCVSSDNLKIVARFSLTEIQPWHALWGCEETNSGPWALTPLINGASALTFYSGDSDQIGSIPVTDNMIYLLECQSNNGILTYECGDASGELYPNGSICKTDNIYVFTINSFKDSSILEQASKMRLYYFQIYDNNVLVRDFVPCINASGEAGLYDKVDNVFYGNTGTGEFITENIPVLPDKTLEEMSWTEISEISKSGQARSYFNIGDQKTISIKRSRYRCI